MRNRNRGSWRPCLGSRGRRMQQILDVPGVVARPPSPCDGRSLLPGYNLYYPEGPSMLRDVGQKINAVYKYLKHLFCQDIYLTEDDWDHTCFEVICEDVIRIPEFCIEWPDFKEEMIQEPEEVVTLWSAVMHKVVCDYWIECFHHMGDTDETSKRNALDELGFLDNKSKVYVGLHFKSPTTPLSMVLADKLGKFVAITGQIVGSGIIKLICTRMPFQCRICEGIFSVDQPMGIYKAPTSCKATQGCTNIKNFDMREDHESRFLTESRRIKLRDPSGETSIHINVECELYADLVYRCGTGDIVTVTGIPKPMADRSGSKRAENVNPILVQVVSIRKQQEDGRTMGGNSVYFNDSDFTDIRNIHDEPHLFRLMVASICPSLYGHEYVKAGLLLSLFGGTEANESVISSRSDINMLMIGDPGIGKSQMLRLAAEIAPNGVYVCGTGTTEVGLTAALVRDGDDYNLEAGALVMADGGVCCIDEFDKMTKQHPALLEAMEQQTVSIAKSGVYRTLAARTTVIAAANPVGGHYDKTKTFLQNVKISSPLLSRFDLIYILLDVPDREMDRRLMDHLVYAELSEHEIHSPPQSTVPIGPTLLDHLRLRNGEVLNLIDKSRLQKYLAYARHHVFPTLSTEAKLALQEYYLQLRVRYRAKDFIQITTRQLEALVRLTQARAKMELRETATIEDAKEVLQIYEASLSSAFGESIVHALPNSIVTQTGAGPSRGSVQKQMKDLLTELQKRSRFRRSGNLYGEAEIKLICEELKLTFPSATLIDALNVKTYLLKKGPRLYMLLNSD